MQDLEKAGLDHRTYIDYDVITAHISKLAYKMGILSEKDTKQFGKIRRK